MNIELDLGDIGIVDAEVEAIIELSDGQTLIELTSVEVRLPMSSRKDKTAWVTFDVLHLLSESALDDIKDTYLLNY